ncbi:hypothetical protein GG344DRAFT_64454 [Lentinula edodes]|nr:hypothetical protein GG344DRAFT_64454 [Lentinula edodes]
MTTSFELATPNVMLTVIGVLDFTISYRAASVTLCTFGERAIAEWKRPGQELSEVMAEKKMALDLGEGFSVALKQSFSSVGEPGLYYEDLYDLVCPLQPQSLSPNYPVSSLTSVKNPIASSFTAKRLKLDDQDLSGTRHIDNASADHQGPWKTISQDGRSKYRTEVASKGRSNCASVYTALTLGGYDENDLDLDLFFRFIIQADIQQLHHATCLNAYVSQDRKPT